MSVDQVLKKRKSVRAFQQREVEPELIHQILDAARCAPSGTNTQPWKVAVLSGESKKKLCDKLEQAFRNREEKSMEYSYYPQQWEEPYLSRRKACGKQLYGVLEISREDKKKQIDQWAKNYQGFGAPVIILVFLDSSMATGSYLDTGMFIQSLMLPAVDKGLGTCPQAALAEFPSIVKEELGYGEEQTLLCGISLGWEDVDAPANSYRTTRIEVDEFATFFN